MSDYNNQYGQGNQYDAYSEEMGWDDAIEQDAPDFVMVPPGDYNFTVTGFERARHNGSEKLPPCNKAVLSIRLDIPEEQGVCVIKHNLFLHKKTEGRLCEFFTAIGQRKHGERINMNWSRVVSSTGRCKVGVRRWTSDRDGREYEQNEIQRFYDPEEKPRGRQAAAPAAGQAQTPAQNGAAYGQQSALQSQQRQAQQTPPRQKNTPGGWTPGKF